MSPAKTTISIDQLTVGATCTQPVIHDGVMLLGAGTRVTTSLIEGLKRRGIANIEVDSSDRAAMLGRTVGHKRTPKPRPSTDVTPADGQWPVSVPLKAFLVNRHGEPWSTRRGDEIDQQSSTSINTMKRLSDRLNENPIDSVAEYIALTQDFVATMVTDHDQLLGGFAARSGIRSLAHRSVQLSVLGMAVATELGLDGPQTLEVGAAGLLHDIGRLVIRPEFRADPSKMTEAQRWEYRKHPLISINCLRRVAALRPNVRLAIEQVHEQFDGGGYPRGISGHRIHQYARILNVADAYLQLVAPEHRTPLIPHDALGLILHRAGEGLFDPAIVRAFLTSVTLFPLGSHVELTDGGIAQVIRRPTEGFAQPVLSHAGRCIDLAGGETAIARPIGDPQSDQARLPPSLMVASGWSPADDFLEIPEASLT